jgi:hypothetical protein
MRGLRPEEGKGIKKTRNVKRATSRSCPNVCVGKGEGAINGMKEKEGRQLIHMRL